MKILPQIHKDDLSSLGFRVSMELAAGGVLTALLLRWIAD
jgi:hypothetical protein